MPCRYQLNRGKFATKNDWPRDTHFCSIRNGTFRLAARYSPSDGEWNPTLWRRFRAVRTDWIEPSLSDRPLP